MLGLRSRLAVRKPNAVRPPSVGASRDGEQRDGAVGSDFNFRILFVVHLLVEDEYIRIISARKAEPNERKRYEDGDD